MIEYQIKYYKTKTTYMNSKLATFLKGLGRAVLVPVLYKIGQYLESGTLKFDWTDIIILGLSALVAYVLASLAPKLPEDPNTNKTY